STSPPQLAISTARYVPMTTVLRRTKTRRSVYIPTRPSVSRHTARLGGTAAVAVETPPFIDLPLPSFPSSATVSAEGRSPARRTIRAGSPFALPPGRGSQGHRHKNHQMHVDIILRSSTKADEPGRGKGGETHHLGRHRHFQMVGAGLERLRCVGGKLRDPLTVPDGFCVRCQYHRTPGIEDQELHKIHVLYRVGSFPE